MDNITIETENNLQTELNKHNSSVGSNRLPETVTKCKLCGSEELEAVEKLLRSADESVTFVVTCADCGAKWRQ